MDHGSLVSQLGQRGGYHKASGPNTNKVQPDLCRGSLARQTGAMSVGAEVAQRLSLHSAVTAELPKLRGAKSAGDSCQDDLARDHAYGIRVHLSPFHVLLG